MAIILGVCLASSSWKAPSLPQVATKAIALFLPRALCFLCRVRPDANVRLTESGSIRCSNALGLTPAAEDMKPRSGPGPDWGVRNSQEPSPKTPCCCVDGRDQGTGLWDGDLAELGRGGARQAETTVAVVFLSTGRAEIQLARSNGWRGLKQVKNGEWGALMDCRGLPGVRSTAGTEK